jgi:exodeoxyribonuclease V beta subunit
VLREFPRGRRAGDYFHSLFEELDFATVSDEDILDLANEKLEGFGFGRGVEQSVRDGWVSEALAAMRHSLATPLYAGPHAERGFSLSDVALERRFSELEFRVPVALAGGARLLPERLARAFADHPSTELPASYAERVRELGFESLSGFLKGFIDLVFEHDGRFYVVDYKTNHLGDFVDEYGPERMGAAMADSHYFLQYHLYTLAVDRFLGRFQPGYDYASGFGGVFYLFIKGMRPGGRAGVFFEKPPLARMQALSAALEGSAP